MASTLAASKKMFRAMEESDFFSCHHDQSGDRKLTLVLYLSDLEENQGGSLNLYNVENNTPSEIEKKILPKFNTVVIYRATQQDFHEIEKVTGNKERYSIICGFC